MKNVCSLSRVLLSPPISANVNCDLNRHFIPFGWKFATMPHFKESLRIWNKCKQKHITFRWCASDVSDKIFPIYYPRRVRHLNFQRLKGPGDDFAPFCSLPTRDGAGIGTGKGCRWSSIPQILNIAKCVIVDRVSMKGKKGKWSHTKRRNIHTWWTAWLWPPQSRISLYSDTHSPRKQVEGGYTPG